MVLGSHAVTAAASSMSDIKSQGNTYSINVACTGDEEIKNPGRGGQHVAPFAVGDGDLQDDGESDTVPLVTRKRRGGCRLVMGSRRLSDVMGRLLKGYANALEIRPLLVKCLTSGLIGTLGDVMSQGIHQARGGDAIWHTGDVSLNS